MLKAHNLTRGALSRHLYRLALPIMGTSFVQMAYSFTDMAWLGRLGSESVAAVGTISVFLWIAQSFSLLNKTASEVTIAHRIGRDEWDEASLFAQHNTTMAFVLSLLLGGVYALGADTFVGLYQLTSQVHSYALDYMYITLFGLPAAFMTSALFGIYNATGNSQVPFKILALGLVCNMLLDPLFIHGCELGVVGAAWATVLSQWLVVLVFIYRHRYRDRLLKECSLLGKLNPKISLEIVKIGAPAAGLNILFAIVAIYMGRLASSVGGHIGVAVMTTGGQLEALTWNTAQGATTALSTVVAQNYAAGLHERVKQAYRITLAFTLMVGCLGTIFFVGWGEHLFSLIVPDMPTYKAGAIYLMISGYTQAFMMMEITTQGLLYGLGRSYIPALVSVTGNYVRIPLALYLVGIGWGLEAVWWAISLSAGLKGLVALLIGRRYLM